MSVTATTRLHHFHDDWTDRVDRVLPQDIFQRVAKVLVGGQPVQLSQRLVNQDEPLLLVDKGKTNGRSS